MKVLYNNDIYRVFCKSKNSEFYLLIDCSRGFDTTSLNVNFPHHDFNQEQVDAINATDKKYRWLPLDDLKFLPESTVLDAIYGGLE